jgi:hypothetical protein
MLDVLEAGCSALQQKNVELAAVLGQMDAPAGISIDALAGANVTPAATEAPTPKRRQAAKRKRKPAKKARRKSTAKKARATVSVAEPEGTQAPGATPDGQEGPKRGKRQALGMSFSKLREAIQARRAGHREQQEGESAAGQSG